MRFPLPWAWLRTLSSTAGPVSLRPYQENCVDACVEALSSGVSRIGVSLATGSGKTVTFLTLLSKISAPPKNPHASRSLIIVNNIELARQSATQAASLFPQRTIEIEQGAAHQASGLADITVATYQTLLQPKRLSKFNPHFLKAIIVDEAHHAVAPSYRRLLAHFNPDIKHPDKGYEPPPVSHTIPVIGFSATFSRHDGLALGAVFERIVYHRDFITMIREQWLCKIRFTSVRANINLEGVTVSSRTGDFNATSLAHVINTDFINKLVVQTWLDKASTRKSTLIFCVDIAHVMALTNTYRSLGIDARYIYAKTPARERKSLVTLFREGAFPVLINCGIMTEGTDIPNIDCIILARPTRSRGLFMQMIGRGMRPSPDTGKEECLIVDFVDSNNRVSGAITTPSLFGLDPDEMAIENADLDTLERVAAEKASHVVEQPLVPEPESVSYTDYEDPSSFLFGSYGAPHIMQLSRNAWVGCGKDVYVLECMGKGYIRLEPIAGEDDPEAKFQAYYTPAAPKHPFATSPFLRSRKIATVANIPDGIRACDTYAIKKVVFGGLATGLLRSANWRKLPASDAQKKLLAKRFKTTIEDDKLVNITKGEAANVITRLKHGAKGRYEKKVKLEQKKSLQAHKEEQRRMREIVQVGPLPT